jgi:hypothetical protein
MDHSCGKSMGCGLRSIGFHRLSVWTYWALVGNGTGKPSTLMRRWGISLSLLFGCVSRLATGGARVNLGASRGMPDNWYQRLWPFIPIREILGTAWWLSSRGHPTVCLGLPCKVIYQSIVGLSPLSETTYSTSHEITNDGSWLILFFNNFIAQLMLVLDG